ncbi:AAA family ATPase [Roseobacter sinensis]|uniref:AAA family ATPase n=1 Tax=Roseobacter sinensis TaxID=2931391 RepID=A0ABT3BC73_9RHOB|nr:AAA family ATPase [Roseobacter sp. WL0113]MCV3271157.1 AAA family ATPase [Roseobacter sp. WL0113]
MTRFILISGCSGGGKSTLLATLQGLGFDGIPEPGRRVVAAERRVGGTALPWRDMSAFIAKTFELAQQDLRVARGAAGPVFFDRGLIDAAAARAHLTGVPLHSVLKTPSPYAHTVFLAPPWPEIFAGDADRRHSFDEAVAEYDRLCRAFDALGHEAITLPRTPPAERAQFVLSHLELSAG